MSTTQDSPHTPRALDSASRVWRLALKELRETLRDRRTIATLVLMPLLVYPILSMGFRQFLLSSFQQSGHTRWFIATSTQEESMILSVLLKRGDQLLAAQNRGESAAAKPTRPAFLPSGELDDTIDSRQHIELFIDEDLEGRVRALDIDLGVRIRSRGVPTDELRAAEFDLIYRPNTPISRQVARYVERRLQAVNDDFVKHQLERLGESGNLPAAWQLQPIADEEGESFWLATLVPMILVLMTITGAVYPAIDLTAGERERGTLEALMAAPVPRLSLLFAKYLAVVSVAVLTAVVNIIGMTITILSTGLAPLLFGEGGLSLSAMGIVLVLLVLFAAFFSAVLLCVTSFARSFKEAQAYLVPLMLVALAPGLLSVVPGLKLNAWLAVAPLVNIVLLARDVLQGQADLLWGFIAVATTCLYGTAALGLAARIFGSDSILYGSQGSWDDLWRRPAQPRTQPTVSGAMACLAVVVPLYVILSGLLAQLHAETMTTQLAASSGMLVLLFVALPGFMARWQGVMVPSGFQLRRPKAMGVLGAALVGCALGPLALELILLSQQLGIATISGDELVAKQPLVDRLVAQWRELTPLIPLAAVALVPAVCEEFFFRGYLLHAMRGRLPGWLAIVFTGLIFGLFHASVGGLIAVERVLSSTVLGVVLGWVCWTTRSVLPGMLLHFLVNAFVIGLAYWGEELKPFGLDSKELKHLPPVWLLGAGVAALVGILLTWLGRHSGTLRTGESESARSTSDTSEAEVAAP